MKYFMMLLLFYAAVLSGAICFSFLVRCYQVIWSDVRQSRAYSRLRHSRPPATDHTHTHTHTPHFRQSESVTLFTKLVLVGLLMTWSSFGFGIVSLAQAMMLQVVYLTPSCEKAHLKKRVQQSLKMPRLVRAPALPRHTAAGTHPRACVARRVSCVCASQERLGFLRNNITLVFGAHSALWYIPTPPDSDPYNYPSFTDTFIFDDEVPPQENGVPSFVLSSLSLFSSLSCFALLLTSAPLLVRHTARHAHDTTRYDHHS